MCGAVAVVNENSLETKMAFVQNIALQIKDAFLVLYFFFQLRANFLKQDFTVL